MTNEELLAAIRQIIKEELANSQAIEPDDLIVEGPDKWGRVKFKGTKEVNDNVKILSVLTVRQAVEGRIAPLTEEQLACLMMNVGCDETGNLVPAFGRGYGQTGNPVIDEFSPQANTVVANKTFWNPHRYDFGPSFAQEDRNRTVCSRSEKIGVLIQGIEQLGSLYENDGSAFDHK